MRLNPPVRRLLQFTGGVAVAACVVLACARVAPPPGGPPDRSPPVLLSTRPDSAGVYPDFEGFAEFRFDEVISEGGSPNFGLGTGDLERMVILSPDSEVPVVRWKRERILVRPKHGWKPNRIYRIELLGGIVDLRNNRMKGSTTKTLTFATGGALPTDSLIGVVVDWTTQRMSGRALIEAVHLPDSLSYRTMADSNGRFRFGPLPKGEYLVYGVLDQNNNLRRDPRESYDSLRVEAGRDSVGEIWAFKHDSLGPRMTVQARDSMSVVLSFSQMVNPYQHVTVDSVRLLALPDSTVVKIADILPQKLYDSLYAAKPKPAAGDSVLPDSLRAKKDSLAKVHADSLRADSVRADSILRSRAAATAAAARRRAARTGIKIPPVDSTSQLPLKTKPPLYDKLVLRTVDALVPGKGYIIEVRGIQNVNRVASSPIAGTKIPVPKKVVIDTTKAKADSLKTKADSVKKAEAGKKKGKETAPKEAPKAPADPARPRPDSSKAKVDSSKTKPDSSKAKPDSAKAKADTTASKPMKPQRLELYE